MHPDLNTIRDFYSPEITPNQYQCALFRVIVAERKVSLQIPRGKGLTTALIMIALFRTITQQNQTVVFVCGNSHRSRMTRHESLEFLHKFAKLKPYLDFDIEYRMDSDVIIIKTNNSTSAIHFTYIHSNRFRNIRPDIILCDGLSSDDHYLNRFREIIDNEVNTSSLDGIVMADNQIYATEFIKNYGFVDALQRDYEGICQSLRAI